MMYIAKSEARALTVLTAVVALAAGVCIGAGIVYQHVAAKLPAMCAAEQSAYTAELERSVVLWRTLYLASKTDGVDSIRPVPEKGI